MLGEELCKLPKPTILTTKRCQSSQANPEFVDLKGSRAVFCAEPCEGEKIKSAMLREITGNDRTRQRGLYGSQKTIRPVFSLFLLCNSRPAMDAPDTDAIWDRKRSVHFRTKFADSPRLPHECLIDRELKTRLKSYAPHLMQKLLRLYTEYRENGYRLDPPQQVLDTSKTYQMENNPVEKFFEEQVLPATTSHMPENNVEDPQHAAKFEKQEEVLLPVNRLWGVFQMWRRDLAITANTTENGFYQKISKLCKDAYQKVRREVEDKSSAKKQKLFCYRNMSLQDYRWNETEMIWELVISAEHR
ncbi:hypothetical protein HK104_004475, partial [Borealophlyctis nickersoniae]